MTENPPPFAIWAVVPAAGIGTRMAASIPKQYLTLLERPVLAHTLNRLLALPLIRGVVVSLREDDRWWSTIRIDSDKPVIVAPGGAERTDSVLNALRALQGQVGFDAQTDRVMVHDAVRPCFRARDIRKLVETVGDAPDGGLLACPVRDTMKRQRQDGAGVAETIDRENLWHAMTPQYFSWRGLHDALVAAAERRLAITDDASAMELAGFSPRLVPAHEDNIKITRPDDLRLAAIFLQSLPDD